MSMGWDAASRWRAPVGDRSPCIVPNAIGQFIGIAYPAA